MSGFEDEPYVQLRTAVAGDGKPHRIGGAILRQARATGCVAEIAQLVYFFVARLDAFVPGGATMSVPTGAQWKARGMNPAAVIQSAHRHEEWAGHRRKLLCPDARNCTQEGKKWLVPGTIPAPGLTNDQPQRAQGSTEATFQGFPLCTSVTPGLSLHASDTGLLS